MDVGVTFNTDQRGIFKEGREVKHMLTERVENCSHVCNSVGDE